MRFWLKLNEPVHAKTRTWRLSEMQPALGAAPLTRTSDQITNQFTSLGMAFFISDRKFYILSIWPD